MPDFTPRKIFWTAIALAIFIIAIVASVLPLHSFLPAQCEITSDPFDESGVPDEEKCFLKVKVEVFPNGTDAKFSASAIVEKDAPGPETDYFFCEDKNTEDFLPKVENGRRATCWYFYGDKRDVRIFSDARNDDLEYIVWFSEILSKIAIVMVAIFGLCTLICVGRMFDSELLRFCPHFVLRMCTRIEDFLMRRGPRHVDVRPPARRSQGAVSGSDGTVLDSSVQRPEVTSVTKRICSLVESTKIPEDEVRELSADGWSCCICCDVGSEDGPFLAVSRLQCGHAMHSLCLRTWLERGRAVCCLCNANVFPDLSGESATSSTTRRTTFGRETASSTSLDADGTAGDPP